MRSCSSAMKKKFMMMPARIRVEGVIPRMRPRARIRPQMRSAEMKAAAMVPVQSSPAIVNPAVIASAAPKLAPEVMPRVEGLASALAVIV